MVCTAKVALHPFNGVLLTGSCINSHAPASGHPVELVSHGIIPELALISLSCFHLNQPCLFAHLYTTNLHISTSVSRRKSRNTQIFFNFIQFSFNIRQKKGYRRFAHSLFKEKGAPNRNALETDYFVGLNLGDQINSLAFAFIQNLCIDLRRLDVRMAKNLAHGIKIGTVGKHQGRAGVA